MTRQYPELTPYQFASNRPIDGVDQDGLEWELSTVNNRLKQQATRLQIARFNNGTISAYDPNQRSWTQKWRDSKNPLENITYEIANGMYTLPQQLTASVRNHADDFVKAGIEKSDIGSLVFEAATSGKQVGMQGTRPIYQVMYKGQAKNIAVTISNNGYIVGANPAKL